jgi:hypothetical protein
MVFTYEADDDEAEVFAVVMGSVAENFRGVTIHEVIDETIFDDQDDRGAVDALYASLTAAGRLSPDQQRLLEEFGEQLRAWGGEDL